MFQVIDIFAYLDYQAYLRDWLAQNKATSKAFSLQALAQKLGLRSRGHFHRVLHDSSKPMSDALRVRLSELLAHTVREANYFDALIGFGRAKSSEESRHFYREIHRLQGSSHTPFRITDQFDYFSNWFLPVLRELVVAMKWKKNYALLAAAVHPPITKMQAKQGVELLLRLGLVTKKARGAFALTDPVLYTGHNFENRAIEEFQASTLDLAKLALRNTPRNQREISTVTFGISQKIFPEVQALTRKFQEDLIHLAVEGSEIVDAVYQLNVQCFPLSKIQEGK